MVNGLFFTEIKDRSKIEIPTEVSNALSLDEGDKIEVTIKKIKTKRLDIKIARNPLSKILELKP